MTKEEILAKGEGEELDGLVAREIMEDALEHQWKEGPSLTGVKYCVRCDVYDWMSAASKPCSVMPYSTNISAAWLVVERMFELGHAMSLLHLSSESYPEYWYCDFRPKDSNEPPKYEWIDHQTAAPVAICKAALLAKQNKN